FVVAIAAVAGASVPAYALGPGMAAKFAVLSDGATAIGTTKIGGVAGAAGGLTTQLTDKARVNGNAIAESPNSSSLRLGDNAVVTGMCVTGGSSVVSDNPKKPGKCLGGTDTTGSSPLLTEYNTALTDFGDFGFGLAFLTPTTTVGDIDIPSKTKMTMTFGAGTSTVLIQGGFGRLLIESGSTLTIQAPANASVVFLVSSLFTLQSKAKIKLAGGIKANNIAYLVTGDTTFGTSSSFAGTVIGGGGCMADAKAKLVGALLCENSVTFGSGVKLTFAPLPAVFP
ncbi:MAG TPA: ice-binding family protein, partial [Stellaceae bacterium]|nr:ice-binding family protein [Stellaceae bacterium]